MTYLVRFFADTVYNNNMRKLSNSIATKQYVPNTLGNYFSFYNFFAWEHFYIDFPLFNKHFKHQGQVCTICDNCNWFF